MPQVGLAAGSLSRRTASVNVWTVITEVVAPSESLLAELAETVANEALDDRREVTVVLVESVLDALVDMSLLLLPDRWDEECHACERRVGDHTVEGRCPI